MDAQRPAALGDTHQARDEIRQVAHQRGELVDHDHQPGKKFPGSAGGPEDPHGFLMTVEPGGYLGQPVQRLRNVSPRAVVEVARERLVH